jgi:hypothetical protein
VNQTVSYPPTVPDPDPAQLPEGAVHVADGEAVALIAPYAGLTALPNTLWRLTGLRRIDLDHNALTHPVEALGYDAQVCATEEYVRRRCRC